ncbi:MAG: hypothetical protein PHF67_01480 [Candidatus Nanoarchaeia archaeon]|nr:hypothetical protein [Candidatus Nanoarchaeia archaeon]
MTEDSPILTLYVERYYKYGNFIRILYGVEELGITSTDSLGDLVYALEQRGRSSEKELAYRNYEGQEVRTSRCTGCLLTIVKTGFDSHELKNLAERLSKEFPEVDKKRGD